MRFIQDEVYRELNGVKMRFDAFIPPNAKDLPAVICIHGGGWVSGDKSDMHEVARRFAMSGFAAFCPQYRLAPLYPFPSAVEDCRHFVAFLREGAATFDVDPGSICAFGNSAGGHLAAMCALSTNHAERVAAAVDVSGLTDLTKPQEQHPPISWDFIGQFMGCTYEGNEAKWLEASPLYQVSSHASPILIIHGMDDDIVWSEQSRRLYDVLLQHDVSTRLILLENEGHAFSEASFERIIATAVSFFEESGRTQRAVSGTR